MWRVSKLLMIDLESHPTLSQYNKTNVMIEVKVPAIEFSYEFMIGENLP